MVAHFHLFFNPLIVARQTIIKLPISHLPKFCRIYADFEGVFFEVSPESDEVCEFFIALRSSAVSIF